MLQSLIIQTGAVWKPLLAVPDTGGFPPVQPVMEIRRDLSPTSQRLARLDTTDGADGTIQVTNGMLQLFLSSLVTTKLPTGRGFWDVFAQVNGQLQQLLSGIVEIEPHVTNYANL